MARPRKSKKLKNNQLFPKNELMQLFVRILSFTLLLTTLSFPVLNSCSGAAYRRQAILGSSGNIPVADLDLGDPEENTEVIEISGEQIPQPEPDNPEEFNYFPYDLQLDTIAYMSCNTKYFFSFKAGAYFERSGVRLSEYFLREQKKGLSSSEMTNLIKSSTKYQAYAQVHFSHRDDFTRIYTFGNYRNNFLLRLDRMIPDLISSGPRRVNQFENEPISFSLRGPDAGGASQIPNILIRNPFRFVLSYSNGKFIYHKSDEPDIGRDIYGRTYELEFEKVRSAGRYVLDSVEETRRPMDNPPPQPGWNCPDELKLEIKRHTDYAYKRQDEKQFLESNNWKIDRLRNDEDLCPNSSSGGAALAIVQKVLGTKDWNINIGRRCISLKDTDQLCYVHHLGQNQPTYDRVDFSQDCTNSPLNYCPHFVSICTRNN